MSSHDARYEDSPGHDDELGKTSTQTGQSPFDRYTTTGQDDEKSRDDVSNSDDVTDTTFDRESAKHLDDTTVDGRPVEIPVDPKPEPTTNDGGGTTPDSAPVTISDGPFATPVTAVPVASQPATSTPATSEPVAAESDTSTTATSESATPGPVGSAPSSSDVDWRELQGRFVDDPEGATKEAGALLERALSELRSRSESGSTEELRTAFRRYRDLYNGLS